MATSSRATFSLEKLKAEALHVLDVRLEQARNHLASFEDDDMWESLLSEWRARQIEKVVNLYTDIMASNYTDHRLSEFKLESLPKRDSWDRRDAQRDVEILVAKRASVEAKANSLASDPDGNISLTKTQLREFFGL